MIMLEIKGVKKSYGEFQLDCSLNVEKGRITGLVGENGAGKSTLFKAVLGLISYDAGEIKILGKIPEELSEKEKEELGVVLAEAGFTGYLKGKDIEAVLAKLYPKFEAEKFHQMCEEFLEGGSADHQYTGICARNMGDGSGPLAQIRGLAGLHG